METGNQKIGVVLTDTSGEGQTTGQATIQTFSAKERKQRALKNWGICMGGAIVSIFLPIVHFFSVPALFFASFCVAYFFLHQERIILGGEGKCPRCSAAIAIPRSSYKFPLEALCQKCSCGIKIEAKQV